MENVTCSTLLFVIWKSVFDGKLSTVTRTNSFVAYSNKANIHMIFIYLAYCIKCILYMHLYRISVRIWYVIHSDRCKPEYDSIFSCSSHRKKKVEKLSNERKTNFPSNCWAMNGDVSVCVRVCSAWIQTFRKM